MRKEMSLSAESSELASENVAGCSVTIIYNFKITGYRLICVCENQLPCPYRVSEFTSEA